MANVIAGKFSCDACGKPYTWKPQLAGKRAKCTCGAAIVAPHAEQTAPDERDPYDVAEAPPPPSAARSPSLAASGAGVVRARTPSSTSQPSNAIDYRAKGSAVSRERDRFSFDSLTDPRRD